MKLRTFGNVAACVSVMAACVSLSGCGGGHGASATVSAPTSLVAGRAKLTIVWPARSASTASRLVPVAANSVRIQFLSSDGQTVVATQLLVRPTGDGTSAIASTASFTDIAQGNLRVQATAYPSADGSGTAQATATGPITIVAGQATPITLTMASTISTLDITPHDIAFTGAPVTLTVTAYDASGGIVLTNAFSWANSNDGVISLKPAGSTATANAVGPGASIITVTETESGVSVSKTLNVAPLQ